MIEIQIPGHPGLALEHLVLDYNGTLAIDGEPIVGVNAALEALAGQLQIHVVTADTFGKAAAALEGYPCQLSILPPGDQALAKQEYVQMLGAERTAAAGNGRNDRLMLKTAALGIVLLQAEGTAVEALLAADVAAPDIVSALGLLANPLRLVAALRS
ncbi:MAG: hypothetical protein JXB38_15575 [Anaerolineales bacterium]|nr:hypothetical protein [Anaerolineales bacterium]